MQCWQRRIAPPDLTSIIHSCARGDDLGGLGSFSDFIAVRGVSVLPVGSWGLVYSAACLMRWLSHCRQEAALGPIALPYRMARGFLLGPHGMSLSLTPDQQSNWRSSPTAAWPWSVVGPLAPAPA